MAATGKSSRSPSDTRSPASTPSALAMRLSQPTETVRVPVSSRPMVCGVVGGSQRSATSCSVSRLARRTSRIRVIISPSITPMVISLSYTLSAMARWIRADSKVERGQMRGTTPKGRENRLLAERPLPRDGQERRLPKRGGVPARSVTANLAESPLGWLRSRGHVTERQYAAGEQLREDLEIAQLAPIGTMPWAAPPLDRNRRGAPEEQALGKRQIAARRRFEAATDAV